MTTTSVTEKENFTRFSHGIVGTGTCIAQDVLTKFIPSSNILAEVHYHPIWSRLDRHQRALVNNAASDGYKYFDVTLIYTILRNVCVNFGNPSKPNLPSPTRGWGKDPLPCDTTPSDDIERIRILKNTYYSHLSQAALPDQEYKVKWHELKYICTRMKAYLGKDYLSNLQKLEDHPEEKIERLREELLKYNFRATQVIQVSPLEKFGKKLSIDQLFAPVVIRGDLEQKRNKHYAKGEGEPKQGGKLVNTPDDMFYKDGEPVRFVFMQGEAAHGKTTYCLQLLRYWCNAKQATAGNGKLSIWEKGIGAFDFVFPLTLRHVDKSRSSLLDMVCYDTLNYSIDCSETIRHVLCSDKYRCLLIVDGLDEWKSSPEAKANLTHAGIPNMKELPGCTIFLSSRPWKFEVVANIMQSNDRVTEIEGLHKEGIKDVIKNVLVNYFGLDEGSNAYKSCFKEVIEKLKQDHLKNVTHIPLLLIASVILLYRKEKVGITKTSFYTAIVTMLIEHTFENKSLDPVISQNFSGINVPDLNFPPLIQSMDTLNEFFVVLLKLGEIAYEDLMSDETRLVFGKRQLAKKLGEAELEFALKVGLLSQCEAPSSYTKQVSVNFLHKSVQEFQAAIYISARNDIFQSFCKHLSSIKVIMELSNVIMFTSGLSPSLGSVLSQQIVGVANTDPDICRYRETFDDDTRDKVRILYDLQVSCYREIKQGLSMSHIMEPLTYHVSDVYLHSGLGGKTDRDTVRDSVDLMYNNTSHIVSLFMWGILEFGDHGITDAEMTQILDNATSLQYIYLSNRHISTVSDRFASLKTLRLSYITATRDALCGLQRCIQHNTVLQSLTLGRITCQDNREERPASRGLVLCLPSSPCLSVLDISDLYYKEDIQMFLEVLPQLKCVQSIKYSGLVVISFDGDTDYPNSVWHASVARSVVCMQNLRYLHLCHIAMCEKSLELISGMSHVEKVMLHDVSMSARSWSKFLNSLVNIPNRFDVTLQHTNLDDGSRAAICSSPDFSVTVDEGKSDTYTGIRVKLEFSRVAPSTQHERKS